MSRSDGRPCLAFSRCWCCCSLKTGTLVIASFELIIFLALLGASLVGYVSGRQRPLLHHLLICDLVLNVAMSILLIYAAVKAKRELVVGWLWVRLGMLLMHEVPAFLAFVREPTNNNYYMIPVIMMLTVTGACLIALHNMIIVRAYSIQMASSDKSEDVELPIDTSNYTHLER